MRDSSQRDFAVYEFKEDDEIIESASGRFASRLARRANPRTEEAAISKITFLRAFSEGGSSQNEMVVKDMSGKFHLEIPSVEQICVKDDFSMSASCNMYGLGYESYDDMVEAQGILPDFIKQDLPVVEVTRSTSQGSCGEQSDCALSDEQFNGTQVGNSSDTGGSNASTSDHADSLESPALADCWNYSQEVVDTNMQVTVLVEFVMYGSELYAESRLIFSSDCIKIDCSDETGKEFHFEWEIADIICVTCQCSQSVGSTWVKVWLKKSVGASATNMADKHAAAVVRFCVPDFQWLGKEQRILSLAPRYKDIWSTDMELIEDEDYILGPKPYISHQYSMDSKDCSEEVVYPKGDPDAVSISKRDLELLQPETFVNDTIIDFYIKYLTNKITPKEKDRFHFFNSFFFRKLVDLDKDPSSAAEGRAAFLRVRKWTRKVNIFEKDFIFIPVNFNLHWSLLVICHPGEVASFREESMHEGCRVPCILHMDSMKGSHAGLKDLFQSYLWEEWRERYQDSASVTFSSFRFIPLELPQQQNSFDCGLFLLHYVELFLKEAPADFNPFRIMKFSDFLTIDWFLPDEASLKRFHVRNLLCDVLSNYGKDPPRSNGHFRSEPSEKNMKKESVEFLGTTINLLKTDLDISVSSSIDNEADKECASSSFNSSRCDEGSSFLVHPIFATKATNSTDSGRHVLVQNSFSHKIRMSPIKEEEEPSEEVAPTPLEGYQSPSEVFNARFAEISHNRSNGLDKSMQVRCDATGILSHPDMTCCSSLNPLGTESAMVDEDNPLLREPVDRIANQGDEREKKGSSSPGNCVVPDCPSSISGEVLAACVVEDSFEDADNSLNVDCVTSSARQGTEPLCQEVQLVDNIGAPTKDETVLSGDQVSVVQVRGPERHKRRKVV